MPPKRLHIAVLLYTLAVTLLRTFRLPNDWAEAHWLLGYNLGIYKRGLVGSLVSGLFPPESAAAAELFITVAAISLSIFALALLVYICLKQVPTIGLVLLCSPLPVMWGHLTGYFDFFLFILTFLALLAVKKQRFLTASLLLTLGALIHESILVIGFPVVGFAILYQNHFSETPQPIGRTVLSLFSTFALPLAVWVTLLFLLPPQDTHARIMAFLHAYGFMPTSEGSVADAQNTAFSIYYKSQSPVFWERIFHTVYIPMYISVGYFMAYLHTGLHTPKKALVWVYPIVLLPLLLHGIAWDTSRIWTYTLFEIALLFFVLKKPGGKVWQSPLAWCFAGLLILVHIFYAIPLMDEQTERFSDSIKLLLYVPVLAYVVYNIIFTWRNEQKHAY